VRDKFVQRVQAAGLSAAELVQDYERLAEIVEPQPLPAPVCRDPDDDHVIACALAAQARLIVSRDKDLLDLHPYQGISILASADALQHLDAKASESSAPAH
jgi:predicted nucleic acid-binding protein